MLFRFCLYGFLKNQRYFEPFLMLALLAHDLSFFMIGVLYAARSLTQNILEIPSGAMADSWGRRKCMIISLVAYIVSFLLFALAEHVSLLFAAMIIYGVGESFRTGTHKAMIFEWLRIQGRQDERTRIYGITRSWSKFGSALSAMIAAGFVIMTGDYRSIFLLAIVPYTINIVNFFGYPGALDGDHEKSASVQQTLRQLGATLKETLHEGPSESGDSTGGGSLRGLIGESMAWEGYFHAVKDYLQPVLVVLVAGNIALKDDESKFWSPLVVGVIYTVLFLLSGVASRQAHRISDRYGEEGAARRLWISNVVTLLALLLAAIAGSAACICVAFVLMNMLQNIWRPVLISRFDARGSPEQGATILSIESQAQRLATLALAPLIGWLIDMQHADGNAFSFWPIGAVGLALASLIVARNLLRAGRMRSQRPLGTTEQ